MRRLHFVGLRYGHFSATLAQHIYPEENASQVSAKMHSLVSRSVISMELVKSSLLNLVREVPKQIRVGGMVFSFLLEKIAEVQAAVLLVKTPATQHTHPTSLLPTRVHRPSHAKYHIADVSNSLPQVEPQSHKYPNDCTPH
jgi:hypothetical protein